MPQSFDPQSALELAAELAADLASGRDAADSLERILAARAAVDEDAPDAAAYLKLLAGLVRLAERATLGIDAETGLATRRGFDDAMRRAVERAYRTSQPISALAVSVDHFERIVEVGGAELGDRALRVVAQVLRGCLRQVDVVTRVGASGFRILLPGAGLDGGREVAERCRCAVAATHLPETGALTVTFGVAVLPDHAANGAGLLLAADAALNIGVRRGRNCVAVALPLNSP
jgi:diguanylate cyclase (GGDEF)-like protein